jgi:hypothetical protein
MITDDELLLYYYRDGHDAAERARIGAALSEDPQLARRLHTLVARLDAAAAVPEVPVPDAAMQRWRDALDRASTETRAAPARRPFFADRRWQAAAAAVLVVTLAVTLQVLRPKTGPIFEAQTTVEPPPSGGAEASAYENGLKVYLASTERRLASLDNASPEERARLIETIIAQNRLYALAAERANEPQLARVLRAFNPILEDLRDGRSDASAADISQLSFELRVMQARLGAGATPPNML